MPASPSPSGGAIRAEPAGRTTSWSPPAAASRSTKGLAASTIAAAKLRDTERYLSVNRAIHIIKSEATRNSVVPSALATDNAMSRRFWYSDI